MAKAKTKNERNTENLVRDALRAHGYADPQNSIQVEEQKSNIEAIRRLLRTGSKTAKGGSGYPEFIITDERQPDLVLVVECKAAVSHHVSAEAGRILAGEQFDEEPTRRQARIVNFAVDGVLHYAERLSKEYTVVALAVSGETKASMEVSAFIHTKGAASAKRLLTKTGQSITQMISWDDFVEHATFDPTVQKLRLDELMAFSRELHDFMREHAKVTEEQKPLLVSGTLMALQDKAFANSFNDYPPNELPAEWARVLAKVLEKADIPQSKLINVTQPYSGIAVHPELSKPTKSYPKGVLNELIQRLNNKVRPFLSEYHDFDVVGQFYGEFLKYTGGDKKALGIVLTPRHVTELFAHLANVRKSSRVLDICAGTGGFLISSMHRMMQFATTEQDRADIKQQGLVGVEHLPHMFALAASNMILRGDGKANLYQGSCFDDAIANAVTEKNCDVGMINPPYSQNDGDLHELVFVKQMLDMLAPGGTGVAIVPMGCAIAPHIARTTLLKSHTLDAVMSMPDELFYPVGTVTCIMVLTAHKPHAETDKATWFGYWKSDGYTKTKHRGRVDLDGRWAAIRDAWVSSFRNRDDVPGLSVKRKVTAADEWCAEAYMETDYQRVLTRDAFEREVQKHLMFKLINEATIKALVSQLDAEGGVDHIDGGQPEGEPE